MYIVLPFTVVTVGTKGYEFIFKVIPGFRVKALLCESAMDSLFLFPDWILLKLAGC